ncbi:MAG TPA: hypothetical protein VJ103_00510 [Candidatus Paceibacterota bacterium]|nr:hypothetical protein [Candidatus Paceibacterota bacterium]
MKIFILKYDKEAVEKATEKLESNLCSSVDFNEKEKEVLSNLLVILKINSIIKQS